MRVRGKIAYFGHRCFLPMTHRMRRSKKFNGKVDMRFPPRRFSTKDIFRQMTQLPKTLSGKHPSYGGQKPITHALRKFN